jgi:hypothetical protein
LIEKRINVKKKIDRKNRITNGASIQKRKDIKNRASLHSMGKSTKFDESRNQLISNKVSNIENMGWNL